MKTLLYMKPEVLIAWLFYQSMLQQQLMSAQQQLVETQQQLVTAQQRIIGLQQQIDEMRPKPISEQKEFWHLVSGTMSEDAAKSDDIRLVRRFRDWNMDFAEKHVKPYVNQQVYSEVVNQMTRGLSKRIAELESKGLTRTHDRDQTDTKKSLKLKQTAFIS